jgi:hypothetical protein
MRKPCTGAILFALKKPISCRVKAKREQKE